ncbi:MAG TPA: VOC family protein [Burkholderiales bacterium]|nr:VOC family protein [Burkholderiales bacterium]
MATGFSLTLSHVGYFVTDIQKMVDFYTRFLKFVVSDRGDRDDGGAIVFMTRDPKEHHQLVFASGKPAGIGFNVINQISFRVDSLATLRDMFHALKNEPITMLGPITHGNALSVYFLDPEGNRVELLIDTPWYVPQPHRLPVNLDQPDDDIWAGIEKHCRDTPGFKSRADWAVDIEQKIAATAR